MGVKIISDTDFLILSILIESGKEMQAVQIVRSSKEKLNAKSIYVLLGRMVIQKGYLATRTRRCRDCGVTKLRLYKPTKLGRKVFGFRKEVDASSEAQA